MELRSLGQALRVYHVDVDDLYDEMIDRDGGEMRALRPAERAIRRRQVLDLEEAVRNTLTLVNSLSDGLGGRVRGRRPRGEVRE